MAEETTTTISVTLSTPLEYAAAGDLREATFLELTAPSSKHKKFCAPLKQAFMQAIMQHSSGEKETGESKEEKSVESFSAVEIMTFLAGSEVDYAATLECASRLLCQKGICKIEGEVHMTQAKLDELSMDDLEEVVGEYLRGFTLRSALASLNKT